MGKRGETGNRGEGVGDCRGGVHVGEGLKN